MLKSSKRPLAWGDQMKQTKSNQIKSNVGFCFHDGLRNKR